jgi:predicted hotdog family 3-hydroxylacyl-ACP dehydratase
MSKAGIALTSPPSPLRSFGAAPASRLAEALAQAVGGEGGIAAQRQQKQ